MKKLIRLMEHFPKNMDAALVTSGTNRRYYTEFPSSAGTLLVTPKESYFIIDARYFEVAQQKAVNCTVLLQQELFAQIRELLAKHNAKRVGIEADEVSVAQLEQWKLELPGVEIVADRTLSKQIWAQRAVKCSTEQEYLQLSQDITDQTFTYALSIIKEGMTEKELALAMEFYSRQHGSEEPAFSFIVATGANTSRPHAVPGETKIQHGDLVLMDFGSTYRGYRSDMTRTVAVGEPSAKQREVYETVLAAQLGAMAHIQEGVALSEVHQAAADIIDNSPYKGKFTHGLGHSLGLDIHEPPNFNPMATEQALVGNVITVEPGIYLPGEFGVRIEDFVYITKNGYNNFTHSPKNELIIL